MAVHAPDDAAVPGTAPLPASTWVQETQKTCFGPGFRPKTGFGCRLSNFSTAPVEKLTVIASQQCNKSVF